MSDKTLGRRTLMQAGAGLAIASSAELALLSGCATTRGGASGGASSGVGYFARFGIDEALIRRALSAALSSGGEHADLFFQHRVSSSLVLEDGAINRAQSSVALGVGVRVVVGDQQGHAYTEELTPEMIVRAATTAAAIAVSGKRDFSGSLRVAVDRPSRYPIRRAWDAVAPAEKLPLLTALNEAAFKADARVTKVTVAMADEQSVVLIATSEGLLVEDVQPMTSMNVTCVAQQADRREQNGWNIAGRAGLDWYTQERLATLVNGAVAKTVGLFEATASPVGEMAVVLGAGSSGILLHEAIGHGMEADFNRKGTSIFSDKIGKVVARPFVSIVDDGTLPQARGSINVDDEGNDAGKTLLVENGVLATYLHDSISAKHYRVKPTGNGRRESYQHLPQPRMRSTYMLPGPHTRAEIIASVKRGIYCESFSNGEVNIGPGDFSFYVTNGWLIEGGRLTKPIKDVNIIGNGPKVLEQIDMVGDDLGIDPGGWTCGKNGQWVPVSQGLPTVRVATLTVGGRKPS